MRDFFASPLSSVHNPRVRAAQALGRDAGARRAAAAYLVEGPTLVAEAMAAGVRLHEIFAAPRLCHNREGEELLTALQRAGAPLTAVSDTVLERLAPASTPQGIVAVAVRPPDGDGIPAPLPGRPLLVAWHVQDPGNLGALLRLGEATGAAGMLAGGGGADPYHPRTVRAAAGSLFRFRPVTWTDDAELAEPLRAAGYGLLAAVPRGGQAPMEVPWRQPWALLVGGEGTGLPEHLMRAADRRVTVPTEGQVESLSVPAAAGMLLYEAQRSRLSAAAPRSPRDRRPRSRRAHRPGPGAD